MDEKITIDRETLLPNENNPYVLWREIHRLRSAVQGPDGFATWQDAAVSERVRRVKAESDRRAALAAQPADAPISADYARGYAEGFRDACKPPQRIYV